MKITCAFYPKVSTPVTMWAFKEARMNVCSASNIRAQIANIYRKSWSRKRVVCWNAAALFRSETSLTFYSRMALKRRTTAKKERGGENGEGSGDLSLAFTTDTLEAYFALLKSRRRAIVLELSVYIKNRRQPSPLTNCKFDEAGLEKIQKTECYFKTQAIHRRLNRPQPPAMCNET